MEFVIVPKNKKWFLAKTDQYLSSIKDRGTALSMWTHISWYFEF